MTTDRDQVRDEMLALAERLRPDLAEEIHRLYAAYEAMILRGHELEDLGRRHRAATVMAGELRARLTVAERKVEDLNPDEVAKARRSALFLGEGFLQVTSAGGGRYHVEHVATERVSLRADD